MRKMVKVFLCSMLAFVLVGCFSDGEEQKEPTERQVETVSKPKTVKGKVVDVTSTRLRLVTDSGVSYDFDRTNMMIEGDSLLVDEQIQVTYVIKKGEKIARKGVILQEAVKQKQSIDEIISHMTIEEKVGQMFFVRCPDMNSVEDVNTYKLGGYILFDKDFKNHSFQQVVNDIDSYQKQASIPLLIGVDEEGGTVNRLSRYTAFRAVPFWSPQELYAEGGFALITSDVKDKAQLLKSLGINVNLAPVSDVSNDPADFIYKRSFGKSAAETATYVDTVVREMKAERIGSTLKHFPGYGNNVDTHTGISVDKRAYSTFVNNDFLPFEAGIAAGADSILVSHNIMTCVDSENPASLSLRVHEILRNDLHFQGVIMTDDLYMDAIKDYIDEDVAAIAAVKAGNDLLVCSDYRVQLPAVIQAVKNKEIPEEQLNASVRRILQWKADLGLLDVGS